jgi:hypothetical protein
VIEVATFAETYAAARTAETLASKVLRRATANATIDPVIQSLALDRDPAGWAKVLTAAAEAAASLPALRTQAAAAAERVAVLAVHACGRCDGSGQYSGPTNATRRGVPYCFYCNGTGDARVRPAARRAVRA